MIEPDPEINIAFSDQLVIRPAEKRLAEVVLGIPAKKIVLVSTGRSQAAEVILDARPKSSVVCWYTDSYQASLAQEYLSDTAADVVCTADWPGNDGPLKNDLCETDPEGSQTQQSLCDLAAIVNSSRGESELTRDIMQAAYANLKLGGCLAVSTDNSKDKWLLNQIRGFNKSVKIRSFPEATVYYIIKQKPLKKIRDFGFELAFRDQGNLIQLYTRPGVFSHRQLDNGARQVLDTVEVEPGDRVIDIGCGSGPMSLALATLQPTAHILAIDSSARAIDCVNRGIELNGLTNVVAAVNHDGKIDDPGTYDLAVANPPYYANFRIAQHFIETAVGALRPGGRLMLVSKHPKWYQENITRWLEECEVFTSRRYAMATGIKPLKKKSSPALNLPNIT